MLDKIIYGFSVITSGDLLRVAILLMAGVTFIIIPVIIILNNRSNGDNKKTPLHIKACVLVFILSLGVLLTVASSIPSNTVWVGMSMPKEDYRAAEQAVEEGDDAYIHDFIKDNLTVKEIIKSNTEPEYFHRIPKPTPTITPTSTPPRP